MPFGSVVSSERTFEAPLSRGPLRIPLLGGLGGKGGRYLPPDWPPAWLVVVDDVVVVVVREVRDVSDESLCVNPSGVLVVQPLVPALTTEPGPDPAFCVASRRSRSRCAKNDAL